MVFLQFMKVKSESEVAQSCLTLSDPMDCKPTRLLRPRDFSRARVLEWGAIAFSVIGEYKYFGIWEEKAMASHSSTLAWKIPWMEEPGRLHSMGSLGVELD